MSHNAQNGIIEPIPRQASYLYYNLRHGYNPMPALREISKLCDGKSLVVGIGLSLVQSLGKEIPGLDSFQGYSYCGIDIPSTPSAIWCWLRGNDRGVILQQKKTIDRIFCDAFELVEVVDAFQYKDSRDLTGYEDGTENPTGEEAVEAALVAEGTKGIQHSSFVAVQKWKHDLDRFFRFDANERDLIFGRRISDNEEIETAPESAHVKRTAQESFTPEAFVLRRSMPWSDSNHEGLMFIAFGHSFAAFNTLLENMLGKNDGVTDALFKFTRPLSGAFFWCPPMKADNTLDLSALGL